MAKISAGLLMYRRRDALEVFLVHPGRPFFARKDLGAWTIPKGAPEPGEDLLVAARREFEEETGLVSQGPFQPLAPITQAGGKMVHAFAFEGDADPANIQSNSFTLEWPPQSGREQAFPEIDRAAWLALDAARKKINSAQAALLDELQIWLQTHPCRG